MSIILKFLLLGFLGSSFCAAVENPILPNDHSSSTGLMKKQKIEVVIDRMPEIEDKIKNGVVAGEETYKIEIRDDLLKVLKGDKKLQNQVLGEIEKIQNAKDIPEDAEGYVFYLFRGDLYVEGRVKESSLPDL